MAALTRISPEQIPQLRILGRHHPGSPLTLFWTASGFEVRFTGSELWVEFNTDYTDMEPWVSVELNGCCIARFAPNPGISRVCLFRGMRCGTVKHLRLLKDVQAMPEDPAHLLQVTALEYSDGEFLPLPPPRCRLEFIGDSITSGEGAIGAQTEEDWASAFFSAENHYARMTADALHAEYRILSQSGWGILAGWDNDPRHVLPPYYRQICGVAAGARNASLGAQEPNDFTAWQPDAVIVNLGTNDDNAFQNPAWHDPATGRTAKLHLTPDGQFAAEDAARMEQAVCDFLTQLRQCNPDAILVWAYGMLGDHLAPLLLGGLDLYRRRSHDTRVFYLPLPPTTEQTYGARRHPGLAAHQAAAQVLTAFLRENLPV